MTIPPRHPRARGVCNRQLSAHPSLQIRHENHRPGKPLASNSDLIEDALKVLEEIEGPTEPLRELLEGLKGCPKLKGCNRDIADAYRAVRALEDFFETEDDNLRGFTRDLNYIEAVLIELEERAVEDNEGKLRERSNFSFDDPPPQEM